MIMAAPLPKLLLQQEHNFFPLTDLDTEENNSVLVWIPDQELERKSQKKNRKLWILCGNQH